MTLPTLKQTIALDRNYEAISLVLETYTMSLITYTVTLLFWSFKGESGILKPKYDSQEEIYTQLLLNLDKANALIDTSKKFKEIIVEIWWNGKNSVIHYI
jgi:hypothetical protein